MVRYHDLEVNKGFLVTSLEDGSPAKMAGMKEGDIIVAFNDHPIAGVDDLHRLLTEEQIGVKSIVTVVKRADRRELVIVPAERKSG
jgi:S1-C subfamily serine protease